MRGQQPAGRGLRRKRAQIAAAYKSRDHLAGKQRRDHGRRKNKVDNPNHPSSDSGARTRTKFTK